MVSEERKKAFVVFASTYEAAVKHLTLEQRGELFTLMGKYSLEGEDVQSDTPMVDVILKMTAPNMDAAERRHQAAIENGKKGKDKGGGIGAPRKGETKEEYQARLLEWKRSRDAGDNPQEPLNNNTNINIDSNTNNDTDINKNTNNNDISDSISTYSFPSLITTLEMKTEYGEEPRQTRPRGEGYSPSNVHQDGEDQEDDYQYSTPVDFPPLVDEGWTPPPPEQQHNEIELPMGADYEGAPIVYGHEPTAPSKPQKNRYDELNDLIDSNVEAALDCKEQGGEVADFMPFMRKAKDAYKDFYNCDEDKAREEITWKMTCLKEKRKRQREIEARLGSKPSLFSKK